MVAVFVDHIWVRFLIWSSEVNNHERTAIEVTEPFCYSAKCVITSGVHRHISYSQQQGKPRKLHIHRVTVFISTLHSKLQISA